MSKVDWSLAPEGATHWDASTYRVNSFMKLSGEDWFYWPPESDSPSWNYWGSNSRHDTSEMIERPKQQQAWSGPEDGLPPVGTVCEFRFRSSGSTTPWLEAEVRYLSDVTVVMRLDQHFDGHTEICRHPATVEFRKLNTAEQQATEKRESAIRELMDIAQVDCRVTAARLVDAGFKREGV